MMTQLPSSPPPRHRLSTRLWHWANAVVVLVMVMSGLMIFNAHPRLYWGAYGANADPAWLEIGATGDAQHLAGGLRIGSMSIGTTGLLGASAGEDGAMQAIAFPGWATIPGSYDLALARRWHLAFAWALAVGLAVYVVRSLVNGHIWRDLHISRAEWAPRHIWGDVRDHLRLRFDDARYGVLQKLAYVGVLFVLLPAMIASGLAMAPGMDAAAPWLVDLFGGRQSARSVHFIGMAGLVGFVGLHLSMVLLSGPLRRVWAMIAGGRA